MDGWVGLQVRPNHPGFSGSLPAAYRGHQEAGEGNMQYCGMQLGIFKRKFCSSGH